MTERALCVHTYLSHSSSAIYDGCFSGFEEHGKSTCGCFGGVLDLWVGFEDPVAVIGFR